MITISEVENRGKRSIGTQLGRSLSFPAAVAATALLLLPAGASPTSAAEPKPRDGMSLEKLGDCSWQVTYRGHVYDLSPLTRESLSRPIENDIRYVLQRVPEANARLEAMSGHMRDAKAHTILASIFIGGLLVTKLLESRLKNDADRPGYRTVEGAAGGFFLAATLFSWKSSVQAKQELVNAVDEFNEHSPYKIEPASGGTAVDSPASGGTPARW